MRTHLFLLLMIFSFTLSKAQWVEIDTGFDVPFYADVFAVNSEVAFVTGQNGLLLKTSDGGETWEQKDSGTDLNLGKIQFITPQIGFVTGANGHLIKTEDGGETWELKSIEGVGTIWGMSFVNEDLFFLSGLDLDLNSIIIKSTDGGDNWEITSVTLPVQKLNEIQFFNEEIGYASTTIGYPGYNHGILKTEDGGANWMQLENTYYPFQFIDENTGFCYPDGLFKTVDGGYNFEPLGCGGGWGYISMYVVNENNAWGILDGLFDGDGSTRGIVKDYILEDGTCIQEIWYDDDPWMNMNTIHFADENTGYIVGYRHGNPTIWKNSTGINTMSTAEQVETAKIKVYPNPASDVLNTDLGKTFTEIKVSLSDVSGKQFISETHKQKDKLSIHTQTLPKGVYVLSIQTNQHNFNKKIIIN